MAGFLRIFVFFLATARYFGAYVDEILTQFYKEMEAWELGIVLEDLKNAGLWGDSAESNQRTLADAGSAIVYRMVYNWTIFKDATIQAIIKDRPPSGLLQDWPKDPLPPGMLVLLMHDKAQVRRWAEAHASQCTVVPMSSDDYTGVYLDAVETIGRHLTDQSLNADLSSTFATNPSDLWSGFRITLRHIPLDALSSPSRQYSDFRGIVTRHLYDTGARSSFSFIQFFESILTTLPAVLAQKIFDVDQNSRMSFNAFFSFSNVWEKSSGLARAQRSHRLFSTR